jgi:hypothetical protein
MIARIEPEKPPQLLDIMLAIGDPGGKKYSPSRRGIASSKLGINRLKHYILPITPDSPRWHHLVISEQQNGKRCFTWRVVHSDLPEVGPIQVNVQYVHL